MIPSILCYVPPSAELLVLMAPCFEPGPTIPQFQTRLTLLNMTIALYMFRYVHFILLHCPYRIPLVSNREHLLLVISNNKNKHAEDMIIINILQVRSENNLRVLDLKVSIDFGHIFRHFWLL